jgi:hypothetical protein
MNFGTAFEHIKRDNGDGMRLPHWSKEVAVRAQYPDEHSMMTAPYLYVESRFGKVPHIMTQVEMFSELWELRGPDEEVSE